MDFEETRRLDFVGYDEKTETWYIQSRDSRPLLLTRQSLVRLVQLYNSIHKGSSLVLMEQRELRRMEEARQRHSEILRDLYLFMDRKERRRPHRLLLRAAVAVLRCTGLDRLPGLNRFASRPKPPLWAAATPLAEPSGDANACAPSDSSHGSPVNENFPRD